MKCSLFKCGIYRRMGAKPSSESIMALSVDAYIRQYTQNPGIKQALLVTTYLK